LNKNIKTAGPVKTTLLLMLFSFASVSSYSAHTEVESDSDDYIVVKAFNDFLHWVEEEVKYIDEKYFHPSEKETTEQTAPISVIVIEEDATPALNLTIPDMEDDEMMDYSNMELNDTQLLNFPDMFSEHTKEAFTEKESTTSFGGRILMDEEELEGMEEYRLKDVREAVRGAEVSLEFKTN
jgi:hypothetical protein